MILTGELARFFASDSQTSISFVYSDSLFESRDGSRVCSKALAAPQTSMIFELKRIIAIKFKKTIKQKHLQVVTRGVYFIEIVKSKKYFITCTQDSKKQFFLSFSLCTHQQDCHVDEKIKIISSKNHSTTELNGRQSFKPFKTGLSLISKRRFDKSPIDEMKELLMKAHHKQARFTHFNVESRGLNLDQKHDYVGFKLNSQTMRSATPNNMTTKIFLTYAVSLQTAW